MEMLLILKQKTMILILLMVFQTVMTANETCGQKYSHPLFCPPDHHCCSATESTCCADSRVCVGSTWCFAIHWVVIMTIGGLAILVSFVISLVKYCRKS